MIREYKVREIRKKQGLTLSALSEKTGLSQGLLSQIERGLVDPTVSNFWKICAALNTPINYFFEGAKEDQIVIRKGEHRLLQLSNDKVLYHELIPSHLGDDQILLVEILPGEQSEMELVSHTGVEFGYVIQGEMKIVLGEEEIFLGEGDSIHFQSTTPHRYVNVGREKAFSVWVMKGE
ncbi:helix-turn-helix domain-containing protein [Cytobacillus purgationiresistens]|uniref:Transcriptional regulator with XRE-family HTH domain n=1 Tax=Cytobacillus purgationiresistens TaxID=863449 RepID=A0ABU0AN57_9BACI|nr:XRE family transcriptional regulator [Cytobacillus purgationiresistens]MDQ0272709.1 transcriptional regulator with XRE-family HTH domain [Cytobacillus purgationiresistens]